MDWLAQINNGYGSIRFDHLEEFDSTESSDSSRSRIIWIYQELNQLSHYKYYTSWEASIKISKFPDIAI